MVTKKKILIVEDDHLIATIFRMFIKELNYDLIDIWSNSEDAIKKIPALKPDIILMDILINGQQDGIEVSEFITKEIDVPIIFITSNIEEEIVKRAVNANAYGFLVKPIDKKALGISIELAYRKHKSDIELKKREYLLNSIINQSPDSIIVIHDEKIVFANNKALELFNISDFQKIIKKSILDFFDEKHSVVLKSHIDKAIVDEKPIGAFSIQFSPMNKKSLEILIEGSVIKHNNENYIQLIMQ